MRAMVWTGAVCLFLGLGCGDNDRLGEDGVEEGGGMAEADVGGTLTAATYNLGLLDSVGYVDERAPLAIAAAAELDADLLCVQEVWEQQHWDALVAANDDVRPHVLRLAPEPGAVSTCDPEQFNALQACAAPACAGSASLVSCVVAACSSEVATLSSGCIECLLGNAASNDFAAIRSACADVGTSQGVVPSEERSYVSGGSYGIGLLSTRPFAESDEMRLDASTVRRAILYGRVDDTPIGTVHVFCTHLTAILTGLSYEGSYGSWEAENAAHVQELIDWADEKAGEDGQVLLLGDLNTGPAGDNVRPSVPENYASLPKAGFSNAFLDSPDASCTFCENNPLVQPGDPGANAAIDHVLTRGIEEAVATERVLDELVTIQVSSDAGTEAREVGLSDHYGLRSTIGE